MKFKFPKSIIVGDIEFLVKTDPKKNGGEFYHYDTNKAGKTTKGRIIIGTRQIKSEPIRILSTIIHELKEMIQENQNTRYSRHDADNNYEFHYNHKEHDDLCSRLAGLLSQFLK